METAPKRFERTYIMIKPDGIQRNLVGKILQRFEDRGLKLLALKMVSPTKEHLETHYQDLSGKKFFADLITYMLSGPVIASVWQGTGAVAVGRTILGTTNPQESLPGTIRGDYCLETGRNIIHGSDSVENAEKEINLWFSETEIQTWSKIDESWVYEI